MALVSSRDQPLATNVWTDSRHCCFIYNALLVLLYMLYNKKATEVRCVYVKVWRWYTCEYYWVHSSDVQGHCRREISLGPSTRKSQDYIILRITAMEIIAGYDTYRRFTVLTFEYRDITIQWSLAYNDDILG